MDYEKVFSNHFDKELYLDSLILLAKNDGEVTQEEKKFIDTQASLLDIDINGKWELNKNIENLNQNLTNMSKVTKNAIIRDLISIGYIDGKFDQVERENIYQIAHLFSIDKSQVDKFESWLIEYWSLLEKGNQLLGLNDVS